MLVVDEVNPPVAERGVLTRTNVFGDAGGPGTRWTTATSPLPWTSITAAPMPSTRRMVAARQVRPPLTPVGRPTAGSGPR